MITDEKILVTSDSCLIGSDCLCELTGKNTVIIVDKMSNTSCKKFIVQIAYKKWMSRLVGKSATATMNQLVVL